MHFSLLTTGLWWASAYGAAVDMLKRDTPLKVELTSLGNNSMVKAAVTNTDSRGYNLFYKGSFLDGDSPVDKFEVHGEASRAAFNGVLLRMATTNLETTQFVPIQPGQTIETEIDVAELYDVETSGSYTVRAVGSMPYAELNSTTLTGRSVAFSSNALTMDIDGDQAKVVPYAVHTMMAKKTHGTEHQRLLRPAKYSSQASTFQLCRPRQQRRIRRGSRLPTPRILQIQLQLRRQHSLSALRRRRQRMRQHHQRRHRHILLRRQIRLLPFRGRFGLHVARVQLYRILRHFLYLSRACQ